MKIKKLNDILTYTPVVFSSANKKAIQEHWLNAVDYDTKEKVIMCSLINYLFDHSDTNGYIVGTIREIAKACKAPRNTTSQCIHKFVEAEFLLKGYGMIRIANFSEYKICPHKDMN